MYYNETFNGTISLTSLNYKLGLKRLIQKKKKKRKKKRKKCKFLFSNICLNFCGK